MRQIGRVCGKEEGCGVGTKVGRDKGWQRVKQGRGETEREVGCEVGIETGSRELGRKGLSDVESHIGRE